MTNFMFLRLLKSILQSQRHVESLKQLLFSHRGFSIDEAFAMIDTNKDGIISGKEILDMMTKYDFDTTGLNQLIDHLNKDGDVEISYNKFVEAVTPVTKYQKGPAGYEGTFEQRET